MDRAKYIDGLENRLAKIESLLKLSGLLPDGDDYTDLGDLERRLQELTAASASSSQKAPSNVGDSGGSSGPGGYGGSGGGQSSSPATGSVRDTPSSTPHSNPNSPVAARDEAEAGALSSLAADDCGDVRFIGMFPACRPSEREGERAGD